MSFHRYPCRNDYATGPIAAEATATHGAAPAAHYPGTTKGHAGLAGLGMRPHLFMGLTGQEVTQSPSRAISEGG